MAVGSISQGMRDSTEGNKNEAPKQQQSVKEMICYGESLEYDDEYDMRMRAYTRALTNPDTSPAEAEIRRKEFLNAVFFQKPEQAEGGIQAKKRAANTKKSKEESQVPVCWKVVEEGSAHGGGVGKFIVEKHAPVRRAGRMRNVENAVLSKLHESSALEQERIASKQGDEKVVVAEDMAVPRTKGESKISAASTLRKLVDFENKVPSAEHCLPLPRSVTPSLEWMSVTCCASVKYRLGDDSVSTEVSTDGGLTRAQMEQRMKRFQRAAWGSFLEGVQDDLH